MPGDCKERVKWKRRTAFEKLCRRFFNEFLHFSDIFSNTQKHLFVKIMISGHGGVFLQRTEQDFWEYETEEARRQTRLLADRQRRRELRRQRRKKQILMRCACAAVCIGAAVFGICGIFKGLHASEEVSNQVYASQQAEGSGMKVMNLSADRGSQGQEQGKERIPCIVVDAGHGGKDPGTLWGDIYEKDINLAIATKLQQILTDKGYQVIMTRSGDDRVVLKERVRIAQDSQADAFVSIHQNALENDTETNGMQIYCSRFKNAKSVDLTQAIWDRLIENTGARDRGMETESDFFVLDNTTVPACLVETGFITSSTERELLLDEAYQEKIAKSIAEGIAKFLEM